MRAGSEVDETGPEEPFHRWFYWVVGALVVAALWIRPIASSLWIDEFGSWWTIKDGVAEAIDRSWAYQGQSPLYYVVVWATRHATGDAEWALRMPSVAFVALSVYLLYRLVRRLVDEECARIAAVVFVAWPIVAFSAIDFRPYALVTLLAIAATLALIRWLDRNDAWIGVVYVIVLAGAIYAHYLFGLIVVPHAAYAIARSRDRSTDVRGRTLALSVVGLVVLLAPLWIELMRLWGRRESIELPNGLSVDWIVTLALPAAMVGALVVGGALAIANGGRLSNRLRIAPADLLLLITWVAAPIAILIVMSLVTPLGLQARYSLVWAPAAAALVASAIRAFVPEAARRVVVLTIAVLSIAALGTGDHLGDWRGAIDAIDERATDRSVVLVQSGYVESLQLDWYTDPERVSYLGAPVSYYPVTGEVVVLPVDVAPAPAFSRDRVESAATGSDRVLLVTSSAQLATWVGEVLHDEGFVQEQIVPGTPFVYGYSRPTPG